MGLLQNYLLLSLTSTSLALSAARDDKASSASSNTNAAPLSLPVYQDVRIQSLEKLRRRSKRQVDNTNVQTINVTSTSYLIELDLGSPAQTARVAIDTGSSELWVNPNCENAGSSSQAQICDTYGHYRPADSDTSRVSQTQNTISYGKGDVALQYVSDQIAIPGSDIKLDQVIFGYGLDSQDLTMGILGLSFGDGINMQYPSVVDEMVNQNVTRTHAFGVALGTKDEPTGSGVISFGGVDTKKFSGDLHTMPILGPQNGERLRRYWVQMDSVGLSTPGSDSSSYRNSSLPVFFDTGATLSYLPSGLIADIASDLGGRMDTSVNLYIVPCNMEGSIDFTFDGYTVKVPLEEFIWDVGQNTCVLGADSADDGSYILGDSFLRSVYTVFDMDTPALHFAPYVNCGTNLQMIPAGANETQKFTGECDASEGNTGSSGNSNSGGGSNGGSSNGDSAAGHLTPAAAWVAMAGVAVVMFLS
ncbi:candidapepsin-1 [Verticillium alfalfae VaMs.102]|uniref:Candidapepsin-1 n=1 Tax=Verticillium alfalfae (strain VaMs.102 / ATCC MYA-4576 / FGSC 10136) TaxID=526221 RepID=C9SC16_VERA1|nr:candidapepsin-1 [Verticillium alfalfae VaMs.102]EEY15900.1 candidapepsin-1 [Verticillium alfalfae VaMs.102]